ncbi:hypothetical protein Mapa_010012 [Marchantia paleacea]|nr:hypothetical protein Mapa_010012 [Marchantia paleacea]
MNFKSKKKLLCGMLAYCICCTCLRGNNGGMNLGAPVLVLVRCTPDGQATHRPVPRNAEISSAALQRPSAKPEEEGSPLAVMRCHASPYYLKWISRLHRSLARPPARRSVWRRAVL